MTKIIPNKLTEKDAKLPSVTLSWREISTDTNEIVTELHKRHCAGTLRILVGAGISISSGFPSWDQLNLRMMEEYLQKTLPHLQHIKDELNKTAKHHYDILGRDGTIGLIFDKDKGNEPKFYRSLAKVLYPSRSHDKLVVRSVQKQIAALALDAYEKVKIGKKASPYLATTNFDPMLELAIDHLQTQSGNNNDWREYRSPAGATYQPKLSQLVVEHIHGWIDTDGETGGTIVLTESQYLDSMQSSNESKSINNRFKKLFSEKASVLIVGMSLSDPNVRRFLHRRRRNKLKPHEHKIYAIIREDPTHLVNRHLIDYWENWGVTPILLQSHGDLPRFIRDVQWGIADKLPWFETVTKWVAEKQPETKIFGDEWQRLAFYVLSVILYQIRTYFTVPIEEDLQLSLFFPMKLNEDTSSTIYKVATTRRIRSGEEARQHACDKSIIVDPEREEGVAGHAFLSSIAIEVLNNGEGINYRFSSEKTEKWDCTDRPRDWRSILAIPVLDTPQWLPVAVITVSSNYAEPFWKRFNDERDLPELKATLRRVSKLLVAEVTEENIKVVNAWLKDYLKIRTEDLEIIGEIQDEKLPETEPNAKLTGRKKRVPKEKEGEQHS